jgi:hypothetical protein
MSVFLLAILWTEDFGCEATFIGLLDFQASYQGCLCTRLDRPPARPPRSIDLRACPIRKYSSIFEYIPTYLNIFEVILKNIKRICTICPISARRNGQARPPAHKPPNAQYDNPAS